MSVGEEKKLFFAAVTALKEVIKRSIIDKHIVQLKKVVKNYGF